MIKTLGGQSHNDFTIVKYDSGKIINFQVSATLES